MQNIVIVRIQISQEFMLGFELCAWT